ncbi:MAG: hypothetical protein AAGA42_09910 [Actinomycetota bacterium]
MTTRLHPLRRRVAALAMAASAGAFFTINNGATPPADAATSADSLEGGPGSELFGRSVAVLVNGNFVVADPGFDAGPLADVGAVYLYDGETERLISTLTGSTAGDRVGSGGLVPLPSGDFVVYSTGWDLGDVPDVGAVTFVDGVEGIDGPVTTANSLHGTTASDFVGFGPTVVLTNGNYVVTSRLWNNGTSTRAGAVTLADGRSGISGPITAANSLVGTTTEDRVGLGGVTALSNGNYVVTSMQWNGPGVADAGAVTFGNGTTGAVGPVTTSNSLHGTTARDRVGGAGVVALADGRYVVVSSAWDHGAVANVGAVTLAPASGLVGPVTAANSLHGTTAFDQVGQSDVVALTNGHYVVASSGWDNPVGPVQNVGAVTFVDPDVGSVGPVTVNNSLHGTQPSDGVGSGDLVALANGNYAVASPRWANGGLENVGAVTLGNGLAGTTGPVSTANSLHGTSARDNVGDRRVTALAGGDYVVASPSWDHGAIADAGAVTLVDGTTGLTGPVSATNSLHGTTVDDEVGSNAVFATEGGSFVVLSPKWDDAGTVDVGAITRFDEKSSIVGPVSPANSVHGDTAGDRLGGGGAVVLDGGGALVRSAGYDHGSLADAGAVTYVPDTGLVGPLAGRNSAIGRPGEFMDNGEPRMTTREVIVIGTDGNRVLLLRTGRGAPTPPGQSPPPVEAASGVVTFTPGRLVDTRPDEPTVDGRQAGIGRRTARQETVIEVVGRHGVPPSATAAIVNVAAIAPEARGFVAAYPCGGDRPQASMLNHAAGQTIANGATVQLSGDGSLCVYTHRATDLIVDITGYVPAKSAVATTVPGRLVDTRAGERTVDGDQQGIGRRTAGQETVVQVAGRHGVPGNAVAGVFNIAAVDADERGFVAAYPCGAERPGASMLNFARGETVANGGTIELSQDGTLCVYTHRDLDLIVDLTGWVANAEAIGVVTPARVFETREGEPTADGREEGVGRLAARQEVEITVGGRTGVPDVATAAMVNLAVIDPELQGFVTAYPCGTDRPTTSMLNYASGQTIANGATIKLSPEGTLCVYAHRATDVIVDVTGYVLD